jgi:hypothetical protein
MGKTDSMYGKNQELSLVMKLLEAKEGESIQVRGLSDILKLPENELLKLVIHLDEESILKRGRDDSSIVAPRGEERLKAAIKAVSLGASVEESARNLSWKEFEVFCTRVLEENNYSCIHGLHFKSTKGRRYECDVIALNNPMLLLADCKHYARKVGAMRVVIEKQLERSEALNESILSLMRRVSQLVSWREIVIIPIIITLFPESTAFVDSVPVVPVFKLNQFIQELPSNLECVRCSKVKPSKQRRLM